MKCSKCGLENAAGVKFCVNCGSALVAPASAQQNQTQTSLGPVISSAPLSQQVSQANIIVQSGGSSGSMTKTIVIILLLLFFWPVGLILMWVWSGWQKKTKIIVSIVFGIFILLSVVGWIIIFAGIARNRNITSLVPSGNSQINQTPGNFGQTTGTTPKLTKYDIDTDSDSVPDFVETAIGYDPNKDECGKPQSCGNVDVNASPWEGVNLLFILDSSGSMAERAGLQVKMDAAKAALKTYARTLPPSSKVGLMVYGHKGSNSVSQKSISCAAIDMVYPMATPEASSFNAAVDSFKPTGWTAVGGSLLKAKGVLSGTSGKSVVVLITDGIETCGTDPVSAVKTLKAAGIDVRVDVIGYALDSSARSQLQSVASFGEGTYYDARTSDDFAKALNNWNDNFMNNLKNYSCNSELLNKWVSCAIGPRFTKSMVYLTNLGASVLTGEPFQGVSAAPDDNTAGIKRAEKMVRKGYDEANKILKENLDQNKKNLLDNIDKLGPNPNLQR